MSTMPTKPIFAPAMNDPRGTFESAIAQIQHRGGRPLSQTPIAVRRHADTPDDSALEKRAVTDAARALAQLWKVSRALAR